MKFSLTSLGFHSWWFLCLKSELDFKLETSLPLELLLLKILKLTLIIWLLQLTPRKHSTNTGSLRNLHHFVMTTARVGYFRKASTLPRLLIANGKLALFLTWKLLPTPGFLSCWSPVNHFHYIFYSRITYSITDFTRDYIRAGAFTWLLLLWIWKLLPLSIYLSVGLSLDMIIR